MMKKYDGIKSRLQFCTPVPGTNQQQFNDKEWKQVWFLLCTSSVRCLVKSVMIFYQLNGSFIKFTGWLRGKVIIVNSLFICKHKINCCLTKDGVFKVRIYYASLHVKDESLTALLMYIAWLLLLLYTFFNVISVTHIKIRSIMYLLNNLWSACIIYIIHYFISGKYNNYDIFQTKVFVKIFKRK